MKKIAKLIIIPVIAILLGSCARTMPLDVSNNARSSKTIKSESTVLFGMLYLNGKYSLKDAVKSSGYDGEIFCVDEKTTVYLPGLIEKRELIITTAK